MIHKSVIYAGLIASVAMGMVQMIYEGIWGAGFWSPVVFIAATILRGLQNTPIPVAFSAVPVVLGLMGHMVNSVILGIIFALLIAPKMKGTVGFVIGGTAYAIAVFFAMWFAVLPIIDPVMLNLNGWAFALAHAMWGLALGIALSKLQERPA